MQTDREAPDEGGPSTDGDLRSPSDPQDTAAAPAPSAHSDGTAHSYDYGEAPPADAAAPSDPAPTGTHPATGVPTSTTPRAVLRPVPEGFPTPPPRPARPNRRPAKQPDPAPPARSRGPLIAGIAVVAVLLLVVAIGGGILAVRSLSADDGEAPAASDAPAASEAPAGTGSATVGDVQVEATGTEMGVRSVGDSGSTVDPEGEFVIVSFTIANEGDQPVIVNDGLELETADGERHPVDGAASQRHLASSRYNGIVGTGESADFHAVFDVPIGAEPTAFRLSLPGGDGVVDLAG